MLLRWLRGGMEEPVYLMACVMTALMFVRPGDRYGKKLKFGVPCLHDLAYLAQE